MKNGVARLKDWWKKADRNFIWNAAAGLIGASEAVILLMVIGRVNGVEDAGIITIAFAIGNLLAGIGRYGVRNYQVTDLDTDMDFSSYFSHRIVTVLLMGISMAGYMGWCQMIKGYSRYKEAVIVCICAIYMAESLEDVFWGLYQKNGRLDLGAKIFFGRWMLHLSVTSILDVLTGHLLISLIVGLAVGILFSFYRNQKAYPNFYKGKKLTFTWTGIGSIFKNCFPLFLTAFLTNYVANAPKYAIDRYMTESEQACYGYVFMPVYVIHLLNSFLYQPALTEIAVDWKEKKMGRFCKRLRIQIAVIGMLTAICLIGGYILGIPAISMLYHIDLSEYRQELMILLFGGGLLAVTGFWCVIMTVMRMQRWMVSGYLMTAGFAFVFSGHFVQVNGMRGAAWFYVFIMALLTVFFTICIFWRIKNSTSSI